MSTSLFTSALLKTALTVVVGVCAVVEVGEQP
ncbi:ilvB operon leader peptide IvbL [Enterobacteriaceae bacterium ESL0689]|nr:ilvB operon leader peptide IvbL [Enterobacteriaceae bacterium ESL0689]